MSPKLRSGATVRHFERRTTRRKDPTMENATNEKMAIILFSGTVDKLMAASILASGGVAMGLDVDIFLTTWGLHAFRKGAAATNTKISKEYEEFAPAMMAAMQAKKVPSWLD